MRVQAFQDAQKWEVAVQEVERGLREAVDEAEEAALERRLPAAAVEQSRMHAAKPWERKLEQLKQQSASQKSKWSQAKEIARHAQIIALRRQQRQIVQSILSGVDVHDLFPEGELQQLNWTTSKRQRNEALQVVVDATADAATYIFERGFKSAQHCGDILAQMKKKAQLVACQQAAVVGMTSTFAALNRDLLERMGPRVVLVEEAGELLEAQLMAVLSSPKLEQVVLIGDHQQLRPKLKMHELCKHYHFDISLFERLMVQGCQRASLTTQLRMQPDISDLVRPFYDRIDDHDRVTRYPPVPGVAEKLFWSDHDQNEDNLNKAVNLSKYNSHEAKFACRLAQHLVLNGVDKGRITLLTPYLGQKGELKQLLPVDLQNSWVLQMSGEVVVDDLIPAGGKGKAKGQGKCKGKGKGSGQGQGKGEGKGKGKGKGDPNRRLVPGVRVVTIDDYQGEENDVVILSLVRCNPQRKLGFCAIENRIIVALSRARHGMYIVGSADQFKDDDRWFRVLSKFQVQDRVGRALNLRCKKHPSDDAMVSCVADFERVARRGGCQRKCDSMLPRCGHHCPLCCHPFDPEHLEVKCTQPCTRPRPEGCTHECHRLCRDCPGLAPEDVCPSPCRKVVVVSLPCGHSQSEPCHKVQRPEWLVDIPCGTAVNVRLPCGHVCGTTCWAASTEAARTRSHVISRIRSRLLVGTWCGSIATLSTFAMRCARRRSTVAAILVAASAPKCTTTRGAPSLVTSCCIADTSARTFAWRHTPNFASPVVHELARTAGAAPRSASSLVWVA